MSRHLHLSGSGVIVLPNAYAPALDPDRSRERVMNGELVPDAPLCQRCGVKASFENPVGIHFRPFWHKDVKAFGTRIFDAICARCREALAR